LPQLQSQFLMLQSVILVVYKPESDLQMSKNTHSNFIVYSVRKRDLYSSLQMNGEKGGFSCEESQSIDGVP